MKQFKSTGRRESGNAIELKSWKHYIRRKKDYISSSPSSYPTYVYTGCKSHIIIFTFLIRPKTTNKRKLKTCYDNERGQPGRSRFWTRGPRTVAWVGIRAAVRLPGPVLRRTRTRTSHEGQPATRGPTRPAGALLRIQGNNFLLSSFWSPIHWFTIATLFKINHEWIDKK